jgi:hypothetical protein
VRVPDRFIPEFDDEEWHEQHAHADAPHLMVYPNEEEDDVILFDKDGSPMKTYRPFPFGFCRPESSVYSTTSASATTDVHPIKEDT